MGPLQPLTCPGLLPSPQSLQRKLSTRKASTRTDGMDIKLYMTGFHPFLRFVVILYLDQGALQNGTRCVTVIIAKVGANSQNQEIVANIVSPWNLDKLQFLFKLWFSDLCSEIIISAPSIDYPELNNVHKSGLIIENHHISGVVAIIIVIIMLAFS